MVGPVKQLRTNELFPVTHFGQLDHSGLRLDLPSARRALRGVPLDGPGRLERVLYQLDEIYHIEEEDLAIIEEAIALERMTGGEA